MNDSINKFTFQKNGDRGEGRFPVVYAGYFIG